MRKVTVSFTTPDNTDIDTLVQDARDGVAGSWLLNDRIRDLTLVSVEEAPATATLTVDDLVGLGVPRETAEGRVNG